MKVIAAALLLQASTVFGSIYARDPYAYAYGDEDYSSIYAREAYPEAYYDNDYPLYARGVYDLHARQEDLVDHLYARDANWDEDFALVRRADRAAINIAQQVVKAAKAISKSNEAGTHIQAGQNVGSHGTTSTGGGTTGGGESPAQKADKISKFQPAEDLAAKYKKYTGR